MVNQMANKINNILLDNEIITTEEREVYIYGLELIFAKLINISILFGLAVVLGTYIESLLFMVFLFPIRQYTGGYHAKTYFKCGLTSIGIYISLLVVRAMTPGSIMAGMSIVLMCIATVIIYRYAPIESPYNPLTEEEKRKYHRVSKVFIWVENLVVVLALIMVPQYNAYTYISSLATIAVAISIIICIEQKGERNEN